MTECVKENPGELVIHELSLKILNQVSLVHDGIFGLVQIGLGIIQIKPNLFHLAFILFLMSRSSVV